jgi:hypothetical protein
MASTDVQIVNLALTRLGAKHITSLLDGSRNATLANAIYTLIQDDVLRAQAWKFATRRADLDEYHPNVLTITGITQANPGVVSYTGTDPVNGDEYKIESVVGMTEVNDTVFVVDGVDGALGTFQLLDTDTSGYTAYSSGGTATEQVPHSDEWEYAYDLPTDCLRVLWINDDEDVEFEQTEKGLLCNEEDVGIKYIKRVTTVSLYDSTFVSAFAWRLAAELAVAITGSEKKRESSEKKYYIELDRATVLDAKESKEDYPEYTRYKDAR